MKIYKWVPISNSEQKKKHLKNAAALILTTNENNKENSTKSSPALEINGSGVGVGSGGVGSVIGGGGGSANATQNFGLSADDSNTCLSFVSDSQGGTEFVSSGPPFSEDSNSQGSDGPTPAKRLLTK